MSEGLVVIICITGIFCVALEVYLPGGIIGSIGAVDILVAIYYAYQNDTSFGTMILVSSLVGSIYISWASFKYLTKSASGRKALLLDTNIEVPEEKHLDLIGQSGVALCDLRPTGRIDVGDEPLDAQTRGEYVDKDSLSKVISVEADHIFVKKVNNTQTEDI